MYEENDEKNMTEIEAEEMYKKISKTIMKYKEEKDNKEKE